MDILERTLLMVQAELGPEIFSDEKRLRLSLQIRRDEGGDRHYVASAAALDCQIHKKQVFHALREGMSVRQIAAQVGISRRRVNQILAGSVLP
jgi:DNA-binding NarL/FixJ family response regulator